MGSWAQFSIASVTFIHRRWLFFFIPRRRPAFFLFFCSKRRGLVIYENDVVVVLLLLLNFDSQKQTLNPRFFSALTQFVWLLVLAHYSNSNRKLSSSNLWNPKIVEFREMKIAIEGCMHGDLDNVYKTIQHHEQIHNTKVDLLLCCGDFQVIVKFLPRKKDPFDSAS